MAWFKVDDGFPTHPKVLRIPRAHRMAAVGLWTIAGAWSSKHLQDGAVPAYMLEEWGADEELAQRLVDVGLWVVTDSGYRFHDWDGVQPSRADVLAKREQERQRKEAYRARKAGNTGQSPANVPEVSQRDTLDVRRSPDPTRPDPTNPEAKASSGARSRGSRVPDPFEITELMREWAQTGAPSVDLAAETERFVDYWRGLPGARGVKSDWPATWRNWMRKAHEENVRRGWRPDDGREAWMLR